MPFISGPGGTSLGGVSTVTGTPTAGQTVVATSGTAASWQTPVGAELSYNEITGNVTVSATTEATATTIVTASAITFDGSTVALIEFWTPSFSIPASANGTIVLYQDGSSLGFLHSTTATASGAIDQEITCMRRITPASGSRTYSIRGYRATSNCTIQAGAGSGSAVYNPAYIRITKVA